MGTIGTQYGGIVPTEPVENHHFAMLASFRIGNFQMVTGVQCDYGGAAAPDSISLHTRRQTPQAGFQNARADH